MDILSNEPKGAKSTPETEPKQDEVKVSTGPPKKAKYYRRKPKVGKVIDQPKQNLSHDKNQVAQNASKKANQKHGATPSGAINVIDNKQSVGILNKKSVSIISKGPSTLSMSTISKGPSPLSRASVKCKKTASTVCCRSSSNFITDSENSLTTSNTGQLKRNEMIALPAARKRAIERNKLKVIDNFYKKLQALQRDFIEKIESTKLTTDIKKEYKFIVMIKNEKCKLVPKKTEINDTENTSNEMIINMASHLKKQLEISMYSNLKYLLEIFKNLSCKIATDLPLLMESAENYLRKAQSDKLGELKAYIDKICGLQEGELIIDDKMDTINNNFEDVFLQPISKTAIENPMTMQLLNSEEPFKELPPALKSTTDMGSETNILKLLAEINVYKATITDLKEKLSIAQIGLKMEAKKNGANIRNLEQLQFDLYKTQSELGKIRESTKKQKGFINDFRFTKLLENELKTAKSEFNKYREKTGKKNQQLEMEVEDLKRIIGSLEEAQVEMIGKVTQLSVENERLQSASLRVKELEATVEQLKSDANLPVNLEEEGEESKKMTSVDYEKLVAEKQTEIENLNASLTKAHYFIKEFEKQMSGDQELLRVRTQVINFLQENEWTQSLRLEKLQQEVDEKTNVIIEINTELNKYKEKCQTLNSDVDGKQLEITRLQQMLRLLEDNEERKQLLRVQQETKIGDKEEEIAHLRQTIKYYQEHQNVNVCHKDLKELLNYES